MRIAADLHIHSALSPCASLEMSPSAIVRRARELSLDVIAVTDHNSVVNGLAAAALGEKAGVKVLLGMEAQTREDIHVLCLFADRRQAEHFNGIVYSLLPDVDNNPDYFGDQVVVDEQDNVVRQEGKLLLNALDLPLVELLEMVRAHDGVSIPSHVEAPPYGLLVNLGMVPAELDDSPLEVSYATPLPQAVNDFPELGRHALLSNSDAHYLKDIGRAHVVFQSPSASLPALVAAARSGDYQVVYPGSHG